NFRPVKRVDTVLEIFRRVHRELRVRLLLIGDGPERPAIERRAADYGLTEDVLLVGEELDPVRWLSVSDVFLLPSAQESFGLAALEAMACEDPVVASSVGGLPEIIEDGVTGFVRDPDDVETMAALVIDLVRNPERRRALGQRAAAEVRATYCTERIVPLYEARYAQSARAK